MSTEMLVLVEVFVRILLGNKVLLLCFHMGHAGFLGVSWQLYWVCNGSVVFCVNAFSSISDNGKDKSICGR